MVRLNQQLDEKYEVLAKIRVGGMGAIYKVRHQLLDEIRVVKAIRRPGVGNKSAERFLHEARAAIKLHHPNIASLHDFSLGTDGQAFIVMEYIEGWNLLEILRGFGPPPIPLTVEIARQALKALGYLHRNKIIHRDISPDNLMLTRDEDGNPLVKLIDLGIAKDMEEEYPRLTATGVFLGKPRYGSPESFTGGVWDERSDLYSFGVVLYELLTGCGPIIGSETAALMAGHLFLPPRDFSETDPAGRVPEGLRAVILRALAKRPEDRPTTAEDFLWELMILHDQLPALTPAMTEAFWKGFRPELAGSWGDPDSYGSHSSSSSKTPLMIPAGMVTALDRSRLPVTPADPGGATPAREPPPAQETRVTGRTTPVRPQPPRSSRMGEEVSGSWAFRRLRSPTPPEPAAIPVPPAPPAAPVESPRRPVLWTFAALAVLGLLGLGAWRSWSSSASPRPGSPGDGALPAATSAAFEGETASMPPTVEIEAPGTPPPPPVVDEPVARPQPKPVPLKPMQAGDMILAGHPGVQVPELQFLPAYSFPAAARGTGRKAAVRLAVLVDENGQVIEARIRSGDRSGLGFDEAALQAAKGARYFPATRDGIAGKMWTELLLEFSE